jgi:hypothetical protein
MTRFTLASPTPLRLSAAACLALSLAAGRPAFAAPAAVPAASPAAGRVARTDVQVDTLDPIDAFKGVLTSGRHSRFAIGPDGRLAVVWSGAKNLYYPSFLQAIRVGPDGCAGRLALSTLAPQENAAGRPFGLAFTAMGGLVIAAGRGASGDGVDVWTEQENDWKVETVGAAAISRSSGVDLLVDAQGRPTIVAGLCANPEKSFAFSGDLALFAADGTGSWTRETPAELRGAAKPVFSSVILPDGRIAVAFVDKGGKELYCAWRAADGTWTRETVAEAAGIDHPAAALGPDGRLDLAFASRAADGTTSLALASRGADGTWTVRTLAAAKAGDCIGGVDAARLAGRTVIAWNPRPAPDKEGAEGEIRLALVPDDKPEAIEAVTVAAGVGRPSLAVNAAGTGALVGGRTGGPEGADFAVFTVALAADKPAATLAIQPLDAAKLEREAVKHEFASGDADTIRRALATVAAKKLDGFTADAVAFCRGQADPKDKTLAVRALDAVNAAAELADVVPGLLETTDLDLRRAVAAVLGAIGPTPEAVALVRGMIARPQFEFFDDRRAAADGIASLAAGTAGGGDETRVDLVREALMAAPGDVRRRTAEAIEKHKAFQQRGDLWDDVVPSLSEKLLAAMASAKPAERFIAREQLTVLSHGGVEAAARAALAGPDLALRARAATVLSRKRKLADAAPLLPLFEPGKADEAAQAEAIEAVEFSWPTGTERVLEAALRGGTPWNRVKAVLALRGLGGMFERPKNSAESGPPIAPPERQAAARAALAAGLDDADPQVLAHVVDALGALRHRPALDRIRSLGDHADARVRRAAATAAALLGDPVRIGADRMLLIDDFAIDRLDGLRRSVRPAKKHPANPVIKGDAPWEFNNTYVYGAVIQDPDEGLTKAWYKANTHKTPFDSRNPGYQIRILYARSRDGVAWEKPDLGIDPLADGRNNVVWNNVDLMSVWKDPRDPDPARRYKAVYRDVAGDTKALGVADMDALSRDDKTKVNHALAAFVGQTGYGFATSPDGLRWTPSPQNPVIREEPWRDGGTADVMNGCWDDAAGLFRLYCKTMSDERSVAYAESPDGLRWTAPNVVLPAPKFVRDADGRTIRNREVHYGMGVTPYEGMYVGLLWIFRMYDDWSVDVILATSRDGVSWRRCSDESRFIPRDGIHKAWDGGQVYSASHFLVVGDEIRVYYAGGYGPHNAAQTMGSGLATVKRDRFAAIHAADGGRGTLTTKPLVFDGARLAVNVLAEKGAVRVEVLDEAGKVVPGFEAAACKAISGDQLDAPVAWKSADLATLRNKPIRLRLLVDGDADLYSFSVR